MQKAADREGSATSGDGADRPRPDGPVDACTVSISLTVSLSLSLSLAGSLADSLTVSLADSLAGSLAGSRAGSGEPGPSLDVLDSGGDQSGTRNRSHAPHDDACDRERE